MSQNGVSAIDSLYNYGNNTLMYDPYFLQALQAPNNYNALQAQQVALAQQANAATTTQSVPAQAADSLTNVSFAGASDAITKKQEEKKSSGAGWLLAGVGTILTGLAAWKCHGKGLGENWYTKIWDGAKKYWDQGIDKIARWKFNKPAVDEDALNAQWLTSAHSS